MSEILSPTDLSPALLELVWRRESNEERTDLRQVRTIRQTLEADSRAIRDPDGETRVVGQQSVLASVPPPKSRLLYRIIRAARPGRVVEFGSAFGVSGATIGLALERNQHGQLTTFDLGADRSKIAAATIGSVTDRCSARCASYLDRLDELDSADLLFFDGGKDEEAYHTVIGAALDRMQAPAIVVVDDVSSWVEVRAAWGDLSVDERFSASGVMADIGVGLIGELDLGVQGVSTPVLKAMQFFGRLKGLPGRRRVARARR